MKKTFVMLFLLTAALLLTACPEGDAMRPVKKYMGLHGDPISVCERLFTVDEEYSEAVVYSFDQNGNVLQIVFYKPDGHESYRTDNSYDKKGLLMSSVTKSPYGDEILIDVLQKNSGDRQVWERRRGGAIFSTHRTGTDSVCTVVSKRNDIITASEEYHLDQNGNIVESKITTEGKLARWTQSEYDALNNEIVTRDMNKPQHPETTYTYESFDAAGNWTKRTAVTDSGSTVITLREITYISPTPTPDPVSIN